MKVHFEIRVAFPEEPERPVITLNGRNAWAVQLLAHHGEKGCTPITTPGPRWSAYVFNLRNVGFNIETVRETHGEPFPGHHARYVLHDVVHIAPSGDKAA